jgi:hypothetical protein
MVVENYRKKTPPEPSRCIYPGCGGKTDKPEYFFCWRCYHKVPTKIAYGTKEAAQAWIDKTLGEQK